MSCSSFLPFTLQIVPFYMERYIQTCYSSITIVVKVYINVKIYFILLFKIDFNVTTIWEVCFSVAFSALHSYDILHAKMFTNISFHFPFFFFFLQNGFDFLLYYKICVVIRFCVKKNVWNDKKYDFSVYTEYGRKGCIWGKILKKKWWNK